MTTHEGDDAIASATQALATARSAIVGRIEPGAGAEVTVRREGDRWIVEWAFPPAPRRGPDFEARVEIDAASGEVLSILAGS
jgi:hypothetical protein